MPHKFECYQDGCSFAVRADSREEIVRLVQTHAEAEHGLSLSADDIEPEIDEAATDDL